MDDAGNLILGERASLNLTNDPDKGTLVGVLGSRGVWLSSHFAVNGGAVYSFALSFVCAFVYYIGRDDDLL